MIKSGPDDSVAAGEEGDTFEELANMGPEGLSRVLSPRGGVQGLWGGGAAVVAGPCNGHTPASRCYATSLTLF